ncbi:MAG TPA: hypothetical protein VN366_13485 [Feifaniaceae bacterium]|nr:hypothetical protein [Feifaniaceae bacterium]
MTDQELLRAISGAVQEAVEPIKADAADIKTDIAGIKSDIVGITSDIAGITSDIGSVKSDIAGVKADIVGVKSDIAGITSDIVGIKDRLDHVEQNVQRNTLTLENGVAVKIQLLAGGFHGYADRVPLPDRMADDLESVRLDTDIIKVTVTKHSYDIDKLRKVK